MNAATILAGEARIHPANTVNALSRGATGGREPSHEKPGFDEERLLIRKAQAGDHKAFMALVTQHDRGILRLALHTLGDPEEAKKAYQETYLKAYRSVTRFRSESSFYTWVYRIATNVCYDHLRKQQKKREEISMETSALSHDGLALQDRLADDSHYVDPERVLYGQEVGQKIQEALKTLTEKERLVFELRHYRNMRLKVIGQILGIPEGTVKNRLFQGTQKLRTRLSELGNGGKTSKPGRGASIIRGSNTAVSAFTDVLTSFS